MTDKNLIAPDGLPAQLVGSWTTDKHLTLLRYLHTSSGARKKYLPYGEPKKGGAIYIDLFCGPGKSQIKETKEWIDGGAIAAWKKSVDTKSPFTMVIVNDLNEEYVRATKERLENLGAPVIALNMTAEDAAVKIANILWDNYRHALQFAFIDPFDLKNLKYSILCSLSDFKHTDMLIHFSQMDFQRNIASYMDATKSLAGDDDLDHELLDSVVPGWSQNFDWLRSQQNWRVKIYEHWEELLKKKMPVVAAKKKLITANRNQKLYYLLFASKHPLPEKFWDIAIEDQQRALF